ncbi:bifunctional riboflavin kinase/FAD synthetase [Flavobacteriaceae bacterium]|nr:bifunctional riboflavin kinase/FAD synthetase [Flavobacteriaceae bacterium]
MEVIHNISNYRPQKPAILTIGTFDGVHFGHQKILHNLVVEAKKENLCAIVLTFFPHPRMVLQKETQLKMIDTLEEKTKLLEQLGVEVLIVQPFTMEFSRMTAIEYTRDILVNGIAISKLIIGYDHRFGRNREATVEDLKQFGMDYNFTFEEIPAQDIESIAVSSTKVRNAIDSGEIKKANQYLGRPFSLNGTIVEGDKIGREMGYPTANLEIEEDYKLKPQNGVYLVQTSLVDKKYFGMMNVGKRPTVSGKKTRIETYFFDFKGDLYGKKLRIELLEKIRDEQKFDSLDALRNQLNSDQKSCQKLIPKYL